MSEEKVHSMNRKEIHEFVMGLCDGKIWTDRHCHSARDVPSCFMVLALGGLPEQWTEENLGLIWEWIHKAGPIAVNGQPTFFSCNLMSKKDWEICHKLYTQEMERRNKVNDWIQDELDLRDNLND